MKKTKLQVLKELEQMHRDKRSPDEIHSATMRYREFAEAEEEADSKTPKPTPRVKINLGIGKIPPIT